jgi:hypothetical protein
MRLESATGVIHSLASVKCCEMSMIIHCLEDGGLPSRMRPDELVDWIRDYRR